MSGSNGGIINGTSKEEDVLYLIYLFLRLVWFWILACPIVSTVIAAYLWLSVGYLGMHWNEGFSSLQHSGYKNFVRMKIKKNGDLVEFNGLFKKNINKNINTVTNTLSLLRSQNLIDHKKNYKIVINKKNPVFAGLGGVTSNAATLIKF
jgi:hypothetical protein